VGAADHAEALVGRLAREIGGATGRAVGWQVVGRTGATARDARELLLRAELAFVPDVAVVALGVNDVLGLRSPSVWTAGLRELTDTLRALCGPVPVVLAAVPPLHRFPALPQPLRGVLGLRARLLDRAARRLAARLPAVHHAGDPGLPTGAAAGYFASDGFHPSPAGYALWARHLAQPVLRASGAARGPHGSPE
jgi:lysophospholipase L1-like esterase